MSKHPVRMVLVGAGLMGKTHLEAAAKLKTVRYVGVVDVNATAARRLAREAGVPVYEDLERAVQAIVGAAWLPFPLSPGRMRQPESDFHGDDARADAGERRRDHGSAE